jgi:hypothetical protein
MTINVFDAAGDFAENKDIARKLRTEQVMPALRDGGSIVIDFTGVSLSTQSFVHALISDALRKHGASVLEKIAFKGCNDAIKALVSTVCDYMQDSTHAPIEAKAKAKTKIKAKVKVKAKAKLKTKQKKAR